MSIYLFDNIHYFYFYQKHHSVPATKVGFFTWGFRSSLTRSSEHLKLLLEMITFPLFSGHQYLEIALTLCTTQHKMCFKTRKQPEQSLQAHLKMSTALELFFNQPTQFLLPCLTMSSTSEIFVALCHCFNDSFSPKNIRREQKQPEMSMSVLAC